MKTGIYKIVNNINSHIYIGSAVNIDERWRLHKVRLGRNNHHSSHLQRAWNKYGKESFEFYLIEECKKEELLEREQFYIDLFNPEYNICKIAGSSLGVKRSDEYKAKSSLAKKGIKKPPRTEEHKSNISASKMGNKNAVGHVQTPEDKARKSMAQKLIWERKGVYSWIQNHLFGEKNDN